MKPIGRESGAHRIDHATRVHHRHLDARTRVSSAPDRDPPRQQELGNGVARSDAQRGGCLRPQRRRRRRRGRRRRRATTSIHSATSAPCSVGLDPVGDRSSNVRPSWRSRVRMRALTDGWVIPCSTAAADWLPSRTVDANRSRRPDLERSPAGPSAQPMTPQSSPGCATTVGGRTLDGWSRAAATAGWISWKRWRRRRTCARSGRTVERRAVDRGRPSQHACRGWRGRSLRQAAFGCTGRCRRCRHSSRRSVSVPCWRTRV